MSKRVGEMARKALADRLEIIGWDLLWNGGDWYQIIDHKKRKTGWTVFGDFDVRLERDNGDEPSCSFYLQDCDVHSVGGSCVGVSGRRDRSIFILFSNHDISHQDSAQLEHKWDALEPWPSKEDLEWREFKDAWKLVTDLREMLDKRDLKIRDLERQLAAKTKKKEES